MITVSPDPVTLRDVIDLETALFVTEDSGEMKIHPESGANRQEYPDSEIHGNLTSVDIRRIFAELADNPNTGSII
jgi:hypothetical protein